MNRMEKVLLTETILDIISEEWRKIEFDEPLDGVREWLDGAIYGGTILLGELKTWIPPEKIPYICEVFKDWDIQNLDLYSNRLSTIPTSIYKMQGLVSLDLSDNHITSLPKELLDMPCLSHLNISHNVIEHTYVLSGLYNRGVRVEWH